MQAIINWKHMRPVSILGLNEEQKKQAKTANSKKAERQKSQSH